MTTFFTNQNDHTNHNGRVQINLSKMMGMVFWIVFGQLNTNLIMILCGMC
jgi:hypothetical protein